MTEPLTQQGSTDDWLGYGAYADALWGRIQTSLVKANKELAQAGALIDYLLDNDGDELIRT